MPDLKGILYFQTQVLCGNLRTGPEKVTMTRNKELFMKLKKIIILAQLALLFVVLLIATPGVEANTGAGAKILNTVQINYNDASGTTAYSANASTLVTVNLVKAALTYSGRPTTTNKGVTAALPAGQTVDSGASPTYLIALTANANGGDTYNLSRAIGAVTNMASDTVTYSTVQNDGATTITSGSPATVALGASVIQANAATTISIPGNSNLAALITLNSAGHKVLVVNGVDYIVSAISTGVAPSNTHTGNTYYNTLGTATPETYDVITLAANPSGANVAPNFTVNALKGTVAAEQILVLVTVNGVVGTTAGTDGTVPFTLTTTDSSSGNSATSTAITTTFHGSNLQVEKNVRNCGSAGTSCGSFAATATGNPGDILEYQVLVHNAGSSVAKSVAASDAVPVYTQLVCGTTSAFGVATVCPSSGAGALIFASITDGTTTTLLTYQNSDNECSSGVGAGNAAGYVEGSALNYFMGNTTTCTGSTGGIVNAGATYTITYRVKMN